MNILWTFLGNDQINADKTTINTCFTLYWDDISTFQIRFFHPFHQKHGHAHQPPDGGSHQARGGAEWGNIGKMPHTYNQLWWQ